MPKAYWIAHVDVRDAKRYKDYVAAAKSAFERYGLNSLPAAAITRRWKARAGAETS